MKMKVKIWLFLWLILSVNAFGQLENYAFKRELKDVSETWHKLTLPDEIFEKTKDDLSDLRIISFSSTGENIEVPFLLNRSTEKEKINEIKFKLINQSHNSNGYYFTFEIPADTTINRIELKFGNPNFDWKVNLEGGQNQSEWFTVLENYRILSIQNNLTNYTFTVLNFPSAKYRYFRLFIPTQETPKLIESKITERQIVEGNYKQFQIKTFAVSEDKKLKQTVIDIELPLKVPISSLKIKVKDSLDFYRPVTIKTLVENGDKSFYSNLMTGVLSSLEKQEFKFQEVKTKKLQIVIQNNDNQPLQIETVEIKGVPVELIARFSNIGKAFLVYGNSKAVKPNYDLANFQDKIPTAPKEISLGNEEVNSEAKITSKQPLFQSPLWLWAVMIVAILVLGWFSLRMLRERSKIN